MRRKNCRSTTIPSSRRGICEHAALGALVLAITFLSPSIATAKSVTKFYKRVLGIPVAGVAVNLADPGVKVSVSLARGFPMAKESFPSIVQRSSCIAAITGTYFALQSGIPIGTIVVDGKTFHSGRRGTALALDYRNQATFQRLRRNARHLWQDFETVLACGPMLVRNGRVELSPRHEGFSDCGLLGRATRCAVGLRRDRRLLLATVRTKVTLYELAKMMRALGCADAMNLDGGTSSALYYRGEVLVSPGRKLVNVLTVLQDVPIASRFLPAKAIAERGREVASQCFGRGKLFASKGDFRRASAEFDEAYRIDPRLEYAQEYLIAIERCGDSIEIAAANTRIGEWLLNAGQAEEAIAHLKCALEFDSKYLDAHRKLADAYRKIGNLADAAREDAIIRLLEPNNGQPGTASSVSRSMRTSLRIYASHREEEQRKLPARDNEFPMMISAGTVRKQSPDRDDESD